jgi:hypothetical protein
VRHRERAHYERATVEAILDEALMPPPAIAS